MSEQEMKDFLAQFDKARENIKTWPKWMQDAAVERAATFPVVGGGREPNLPEGGAAPCITCAANHYCPTHNPAPRIQKRDKPKRSFPDVLPPMSGLSGEGEEDR